MNSLAEHTANRETTCFRILKCRNSWSIISAYGGAGVRWTPLPQAEAPTEPTGEKRRRRYLKNHRPILYTNLLTSCKLSEHLAEIEEECAERMDSLVKAMAKQEGVTEALKAADQVAWVRRVNNIRNRAEEIVLNEIVYV